MASTRHINTLTNILRVFRSNPSYQVTRRCRRSFVNVNRPAEASLLRPGSPPHVPHTDTPSLHPVLQGCRFHIANPKDPLRSTSSNASVRYKPFVRMSDKVRRFRRQRYEMKIKLKREEDGEGSRFRNKGYTSGDLLYDTCLMAILFLVLSSFDDWLHEQRAKSESSETTVPVTDRRNRAPQLVGAVTAAIVMRRVLVVGWSK